MKAFTSRMKALSDGMSDLMGTEKVSFGKTGGYYNAKLCLVHDFWCDNSKLMESKFLAN